MEKIPFSIDENGHMISDEVNARDTEKNESGYESELPESIEASDKVTILTNEFKAYMQAVDDKNRRYGIKNYAKDNESGKRGPSEAMAASMTKER